MSKAKVFSTNPSAAEGAGSFGSAIARGRIPEGNVVQAGLGQPHTSTAVTDLLTRSRSELSLRQKKGLIAKIAALYSEEDLALNGLLIEACTNLREREVAGRLDFLAVEKKMVQNLERLMDQFLGTDPKTLDPQAEFSFDKLMTFLCLGANQVAHKQLWLRIAEEDQSIAFKWKNTAICNLAGRETSSEFFLAFEALLLNPDYRNEHLMQLIPLFAARGVSPEQLEFAALNMEPMAASRLLSAMEAIVDIPESEGVSIAVYLFAHAVYTKLRNLPTTEN